MLLQSILRSVNRSRLTIVMLRKKDYSNSNGVVEPPSPEVNSFKSEIDTEASDYERAISKLNSLQSNAASIRQSVINKKQQTTLDETVKYLNRSGISLDDLDKLSVIHVSGTKGKGSTCALTESILRGYGVRTGFFSSPHLISVTERIRINGEAISKKQFTRTFWKVYDKLEKNKDCENDMPAYFKFLFLLCCHVFFEEKVDVAILEVGIGGEYDCTNVVRNTKTVGITSLGLEHTNILGDTIEEIAKQKAGIIKSNSEVYTNVKQLVCLKVLEEKAREKNAKVIRVPDMSEYNWPQCKPIDNKMAQLNGSVAIQLAYSWLKQSISNSLNGLSENFLSDGITLTVSDKVIKAFDNCVIPGRCQFMDFHNFRLHLDGAHTLESMEICGEWFRTAARGGHIPKILIFNATGERDSKAMLNILIKKSYFDLVCFVPNIPFTSNAVGDIQSVYCHQDQLKRAELHANNWRTLIEDGKSGGDSLLFGTILEAFLHLEEKFENKQIDILVTGSIHLLGATILALEEFGKLLKTQSLENNNIK